MLLRGRSFPKLPDRFEERQALDVADRAADLDQHEIDAVIILEDEFLDRVGDVRDDLDGRAEIIAAAFLRENFLIDAAGGDSNLVVLLAPGSVAYCSISCAICWRTSTRSER